MEAVIETIRIAAAAGASDDERHRGIAACRALADALEGTLVTAPLDVMSPPGDSAPEVVAGELVSGIELDTLETPPAEPLAPNPFAGLSADQILDLVIGRLSHAVGDSAPPAPLGRPFRLTLVPIPRVS